MLRNWMADVLDAVNVGRVEVDLLTDDEAEIVAAAKPELRDLLFGTRAVRDVVRRPFFAKVLQQNLAVEGGRPAFEPRSEVDLIENWWLRGGYGAVGQDALARQRALVELAGIRSRNLSIPVGIRHISQAAQGLLEQLVQDGLIQNANQGHSVRFAHDIYFEWAYFHTLMDQGDDWLEEIRACGEPPAVSRAVELLSQWEYSRRRNWDAILAKTASAQMRSQWTRAWLLGPLGISGFSSDETQFARTVFANDFQYLKKALVA